MQVRDPYIVGTEQLLIPLYMCPHYDYIYIYRCSSVTYLYIDRSAPVYTYIVVVRTHHIQVYTDPIPVRIPYLYKPATCVSSHYYACVLITTGYRYGIRR
jgi:hypothetical protein